MKEELQELITEMQDICNSISSSSKKDRIKNLNHINGLIRLASCFGKLKSYPKYSIVADEMLDLIEAYDPNDPYSAELIIAHTELVISYLNKELNESSLLDSLKVGYGEIKDIIHTAISSDELDELKDVCKEKAKQVKSMYRKAEEVAKSKLKSWLSSNDDK